MTVTNALAGVRERLGSANVAFDCCDTRFEVSATGHGAESAVERAKRTALTLAEQLNAFDDGSAVARLNATGRVENEHVARVVRRGLAYCDRTDGAFAVRRGDFEHDLKAYLRSESDSPPDAALASEEGDPSTEGAIRVDGDVVTADRPVDLNGLAKGYVVDRAAAALDGPLRAGFVNGGGDVSELTGPVGIESPYGDETPLLVLDTDWNVASSAGYRRRRGAVDHVYDPVDGAVGARHDLVTVVAHRDVMEADALATTLAARPLDDTLALAEEWAGAEALVVHQGVFHRTGGFQEHVHDA